MPPARFSRHPFTEAAILTAGCGRRVERRARSGSGAGNSISLSHEQRFPHSLGMLYSAFTYYAGFRVNSGEYKLMGLAPYGTAALRRSDPGPARVRIMDDGSLWLDMTVFQLLARA